MTASLRRVGILIGQLGFGGAERQVFELATRLPRSGFEAVVLHLGGEDAPFGSALRAKGVSLVTFERRGGFDVRRAVSLHRWLRAHPVDLLHSFLLGAAPYAWFASRFGRRVPLVVGNRNVAAPRDPLRHSIEGYVLRNATAVTANSEAVRDDTAGRFGLAPEAIQIIPNGVDTEEFRPEAHTARTPLRVGTVGSLTEKKQPSRFGQLARELGQRRTDISFHHLGSGPLGNALSTQFGSDVEYLPATKDVAGFLRSLDLFVLTSEREGMPNVVLEAMASGLPVVATDAGGTREAVEDGHTGYIVSADNPSALMTRCEELLSQPELRRRLGAAGRSRVEENFSCELMVASTAKLYRRFLGEASPP